MKAVLAAAALALLLPLSPVAAADGPHASITVTGEGEVTGAPDMATVSIGVTTTAATAAAALAQNSEQVAQVIAGLKSAGIEPRDIQTSGLSLNPMWPGRSGDTPATITGYQASNTVSVRVRALPGLGELLDQVVGNGANTLNGISFGLADPRPATDEARRRAVADARARAELLAGAAGVELGSILSISESGGGQVPQPMYRREAAMAVPVEGGEVGVTAAVTITWALDD